MRLHIITPASRVAFLPLLLQNLETRFSRTEVIWHVGVNRPYPEDLSSTRIIIDRVDFPEPDYYGDRIRNHFLDRIFDGWVYFLDDDNLIHPALEDILHRYADQGDWIITRQVLRNGSIYLSPTYPARVCYIDSGQCLVRRDAIQEARFVPVDVPCSDGRFYETLNQIIPPERVIIVDEPAAYYNYLRGMSYNRPIVVPHRRDLLSYFPKGRAAEWGVARGCFTQDILRLTTVRELWLIDIWGPYEGCDPNDFMVWTHEEGLRIYYDVVRTFGGNPRVRILRSLLEDVIPLFPDNYFDWVYIDACHTYEAVLRHLDLAWRVVRSGGVIAGHDYQSPQGSPHTGVKRAVDLFVKQRGLEINYLSTEADGSFGIIKP